MPNTSWKSVAKSWVGIASACAAIIAAGWLLSVHIHARIVAPSEKAYVEELKEKARTDTEVQKILQPELERQQQSAVRTRNVYDRGGLLLLVMAGTFLAWFRWLRPGAGEWKGVPWWLLKYLDRSSPQPAIELAASGEEYCQMGQRECKRYGRKGPCDLPECPLVIAEKRKTGKGTVAIPYAFQPVDERIYGRLSALAANVITVDSSRIGRNGDDSHALKADIAAQSAPIEIRIGLASCGLAAGGEQVRSALEKSVASLGGGARVKAVGCNGLCHSEPLIEIVTGGRRARYAKVKPGHARKLVRQYLNPRGLARRVGEQIQNLRERLLEDESWVPSPEPEREAPLHSRARVRVVLENCGEIDPLSLEEYRRRKGFQALEKCLRHCSPEEVIGEVRASGLRNRNATGFQTAEAWDQARNANSSPQPIIWTASDNDPGSFIDRALLESDPFRIIEGMAIAAYAAGVPEGLLLIRPENNLALRTMHKAIALAEQQGLLGEHILGSPFSFVLRAQSGQGAVTDGNHSGSLSQGAGGMETLACLPWILREGAQVFAALGTETSKGTKVFSLTGKVDRGGLIEVPMGITLREIVEEFGGGIKDGGCFKAAFIGGFEGGCLPASLGDTRVDFEELAAAGASMGSGGLLILDHRSCAVDIARYFLHYSRHVAQMQPGSCCPSCQEGVRRLMEVVERISDGNGDTGDLKAIEEISDRIKNECGCQLSRSAPNPVLATLRHFRGEYEGHIRERRCAAAVCKSLIHYRILDNCTGCTLCAQVCPVSAIQAQPYQVHKIQDDLCTRCGMCVTVCPENAVRVD